MKIRALYAVQFDGTTLIAWFLMSDGSLAATNWAVDQLEDCLGPVSMPEQAQPERILQ